MAFRINISYRFQEIAITFLTIAGFAGTYWSFYPGLMTSDSVDQFEQAQRFAFSDWHPPIMALIWHYLDRLSAGTVGLFALILGLYWSGFWLLAVRFARSRPSLGYLTLLAAFSPMLVTIPAMLWKDSLVFSCFLSASGLLAASASRTGIRRAVLITPALLLLLTGALARHNAMLAAAPLLLLAVRRAPLQTSGAQASHAKASHAQATYAKASGARVAGAEILRLGVIILATVAATSLASWLLNRHALDARQTGVANSLMAFDIVGVAARTGSNGLPGSWSGDEQHRIINDCYEPWAWDSLSWGRCAFVRERLVASGHWQHGLRDPWLTAIASHPRAYISHRFAYARMLLRPLPASFPQPEPISRTYGFTANGGYRAIAQTVSAFSGAPIIADLWRPGLWVAFAMATCVVAGLRGRRHLKSCQTKSCLAKSCQAMSCQAMSRQAGYFALSGLLYALPLVVVGVASEFRYVYWTIGAVFIATLILASDWLAERVSRRAGALPSLPDPPLVPAEPLRA
ncbi:hypothetical protein C7450_106434 [Chelatococcus asaccharovorans]|uniref:Uncharacterized protein n=2 Tax=Chelatococcus asaccharovorans TaxID=28210 RepID=A0A2V3U831_9HYPH|nr:hypothetical protein C7450_106434 [Chelatococcus asaccharovorans]